jgi:cysteine-rich repeat protein
VAASCGDGFTEAGFEQCDDANQSNTDACLNSCVAASCGDGFTEGGVEQCDDANGDNTDACLNSCAAATCGDGFTYAGFEACDDANGDNTDACLDSCAAASCGDGFTEAGVEQCDDANQANTDACLNTCAAASCGDGFTEAGIEQCDDANQINTDDCLSSCAFAVCGDGFVEAGIELCDDGNQNNSDACHNDCTPETCGDGEIDGGEECDDGGRADGDGCGHSCLVERCGDGLTQFFRGEQCDDGNLGNGDGCDAACQAEPFVTTAAILVSDQLACTTAVANAARKVAVDGSGTVYVVMQCGSSAHVVVSADRGQSFSPPLDLSADVPDGPVTISQVAINNGPSGVAYVAMMLNTGAIYLRTTVDGGASWSAPAAIGGAASTSAGLSLQSFNDDVYVGFSTGGGISVARNHSRGSGTFEITNVSMGVSFFDLLYDIVQGTLVVAADTPNFHVRVSTDAGESFAAEVNPPGQEFYSDWAIGNGSIFTSGINLFGTDGSLGVYVIPASNPTTSTFVSGLPSVSTPQSRSVTADAAGNAFVASQLNGGGVQIDRLPVGAGAFDTARVLSATAGSPIAAPLPGNQGVAVVYTEGTSVFATMQVYGGI